MRSKLLTVTLMLSLILLAIPSLRPQEVAEASALLQTLPNLNGANIYFTEANGEASRFNQLEIGLSRFAGLLRRQGANLFTLEWRTRFPTDADLIIIAGPLTEFTPDQTARLWAYTINGGKLLLVVDPTAYTTSAAWPQTNGFFSLMWNDLSIRGRNDVVVIESSRANVVDAESTDEPGQSADTLASRILATDLAANHPITASLTDPLQFFASRSVEFDASLRDYSVIPLVTSDSNFYGENQFAAYVTNGTFDYNIGGDIPRGPLALAVAFEDPRNDTRLVLIGDRDFATNGAGFLTSPAGSASFLYPDNVRFMMNAVAWLLEAESVEYDFPTPGPSATSSLTPTLTPTFTPTPEVIATPTPSS